MAILAIGLIGGALASSVGLSFSLGFAVFGTIAQLLLQPHPKDPTFKAAGSAWGRTWPIVYNNFRCAGQLLQASDVSGHHDKFKKGQEAFSQTLAIGFCEGIHSIGRIWADNQVIYDSRPISDPPLWDADTDYAAGDAILPFSGATVQLIATIDGHSGLTEPTWNLTINASNTDNTEVWIAAPYVRPTNNVPAAPPVWQAGKLYNTFDTILPFVGATVKMAVLIPGTSGGSPPTWDLNIGATTPDGGSLIWIAETYNVSANPFQSYAYTIRIYQGDETQLPDSALEELVGVGLQPGYRGLVYIVLENFDLSRYGNRIPNLEAEILPPPSTPFAFSQDTPPDGSFSTAMADPDGRFGYYWGDKKIVMGVTTWSIIKVDLSLGEVLQISPTINKATNWPDTQDGPPVTSLTGSKLWYWTFNQSDGNNYVMSHDKTTLAVVDTYLFSGSFFAVSQIAVNGDGSMAALYDGANSLLLMNLTTGANSITNLTTVGLTGSPSLWLPTFDASGHIWFYDDAGNFWRFNVLQSGGTAPAVSAGISINARTNDGSNPGPLSFNPDTGIMTAFSDDNSGDLWAVPIDTVSSTPGSPALLSGIAVTSFTFGNGDLLGWHRGRYLAVAGQNFGIPDHIGLYDTQTMTVTDYDWSFWGESGAGQEMSSAMANFSGTSVVAIDFHDHEAWFFPINASGDVSLADICADVSQRVGMSGADYDYSALAAVFPKGAAVLDRGAARSFLEAMQPAFFYDLTDIGDQVIGSLRSAATLVATIPEADLGAIQSGNQLVDKLSTQRNNDLEIPQDLEIQFYDIQHDYLQGSVPARRSEITQYSSGRNSLSVPVVMSPGEAANAAERTLYLSWVERESKKTNLPLDYVYLTPVDFVSAVKNSINNFLRLSKLTLNPNMVIDLEGVGEDLGTYSLIAPAPLADITSGIYRPQTVNPISAPVLIMVDVAPLRTADVSETGIYAVGSVIDGGGWDGEQVLESSDNATFNQPTGGVLTGQSSLMQAISVLGYCAAWQTWDRVNTLDVTVINGSIGSATEAAVIDSLAVNLFFISDGAGGGELFQAATATFLGGQSYRLSDLLRGRFGTEAFIGTAALGQYVTQIISQTKMADITYANSDIGSTRYWKGVNDAPSTNQTAVQTLTMANRRQMPWSPFYMKATRDGSGNITITGLHRMRFKGQPLWSPPETDSPVKTEIDIFNSFVSPSSVVRTLTDTLTGSGSGITVDAAAFTAYYSATDQVTDFSSTQAEIYINGYKISALMGRGNAGGAVV